VLGRKNKEMAILFSSMDKNFDIWPITGHFFSKYWPDCPFEMYLGANGEEKTSFDYSHREFISEESMKKIKIGLLKPKIYWWLPNKYKNKVRKIFGKSEL